MYGVDTSIETNKSRLKNENINLKKKTYSASMARKSEDVNEEHGKEVKLIAIIDTTRCITER